MKPNARTQTVIDFITLADHTKKPADSLISGEFRQKRYIGSKDRADIANRFYRILRSHARLIWWLQKMSFSPTPRMRVMLDVLFNDGQDAVLSFFNGEIYAPEMISDSEKLLLDKMANETLNHKDMPEPVRYECPEWIYPNLKDLFQDDFSNEMSEMLEPAALHLRVNALKGDRQDIVQKLTREDIKVEEGALSPLALIVDGRPALSATETFKNGFVEVQDQGSQLIALLTGVKSGDRVSDFCSGAGGKALALGAMMDNKGLIVASDVLEGKLRRAKTRYKRAGVYNIETRTFSSENDKWVKRNKGRFDKVLTDVPCSGTGTWKRNPDMRWNFLGPDLETLLPLQQNILKSASRMVKSGGELIYATCSLLREENEAQIETFIKHDPDFEVLPIKDIWAERVGTDNPGFDDYMRLTPSQSHTDGFFACVLKRK